MRKILENDFVETSAPCRIDMGGTLDIRTFQFPLRHLGPCTANLAIDMRTRVTLSQYKKGIVKIVSRGFEDAEFPLDLAPFNHPMGLMFAIAAYFRAGGVVIRIDSSSPPRSALGGSSVAAVALVGAFSAVLEQSGEKPMTKCQVAMLAHGIEESVAGVPCGFQDQLAAVFGGANVWRWPGGIDQPPFTRDLLVDETMHEELNRHLLVAYCGIPHESKQVNSKWVAQFISGSTRKRWGEIILFTKKFIDSIQEGNYKGAAHAMENETRIRMDLTPEVLDETGYELVRLAKTEECGARFTGAGGGGCIWAIGEVDDIERLRTLWMAALEEKKGACILETRIDSRGLLRTN